MQSCTSSIYIFYYTSRRGRGEADVKRRERSTFLDTICNRKKNEIELFITRNEKEIKLQKQLIKKAIKLLPPDISGSPNCT